MEVSRQPRKIAVMVNTPPEWRYRQEEANGRWSCYCNELGLHAQGSTFSEMLRHLQEALYGYVLQLWNDDDTERMTKHGWKFVLDMPPEKTSGRYDVSIPFTMRTASERDKCSALVANGTRSYCTHNDQQTLQLMGDPRKCTVIPERGREHG